MVPEDLRLDLMERVKQDTKTDKMDAKSLKGMRYVELQNEDEEKRRKNRKYIYFDKKESRTSFCCFNLHMVHDTQLLESYNIRPI